MSKASGPRGHSPPGLLVAGLTLVCLALVCGCTAGQSEDPPAAAAPSAASSATTAPESRATPARSSATPDARSPGSRRSVIAISVDGLNPDAITALGPRGTPTLHWLMSHGVSTLNARTAVEQTHTLPNHTGMVTGRPVGGRTGHRVTFNSDRGTTTEDTAGHYVAGMFDVVHDASGSTAFYSSKSKLDLLDRSWDAGNGARDVTGEDDGTDKIDTYAVASEDANIQRLLRRLATRRDDLSFVHLAAPDTAGHARGFMSPSYLAAVRRTDAQVGAIVQAVRDDAELARTVDVVLTSDHGGLGPNHDDPRDPQNYRVPFLAWGPGIGVDLDLYAINPARRDPGVSRPGYAGVQPIRNGELGNVVTGLLGLPAISGSVLDAEQDLRLS